MEEVVLDAMIEAVIFAVRKDLINTLMDTECCKWSKRRVRKLCKKLQKRQDDLGSIQDAKDYVKEKIGPSISQSSMDSEDSIIIKFAKRISVI